MTVKMSPLAALAKAHKAMAISKADISLVDYVAKYKENNVARMNIINIESKFVAHFCKPETGQLGFRTQFTLADGQTVAAFSNAMHEFFCFFARLMNREGDAHYQSIDIAGNLLVDVTVVPLANNKSNYDFSLVEEGSRFEGLGEYVSDLELIMLGTGQAGFTQLAATNEPPLALPETATQTEATPETKPKK